MKKLLALLLALLMVLSLAACGSKKSEETTEDTTETTTDNTENDSEQLNEAKKQELEDKAATYEAVSANFTLELLIGVGDYEEAYAQATAFANAYDDCSYRAYMPRDYLAHLSIENGEVVYDGWTYDSNYDQVKQDYDDALSKLKQGNLADGYYLLQKVQSTGTDSCLMDYAERLMGGFTLDGSGNPTAFDTCLGVLGYHVDMPMYIESVSVPETGEVKVGDTFTLTIVVHSELGYAPFGGIGYPYDGLEAILESTINGMTRTLTYSFEALPSLAGEHVLNTDSITIEDEWGNELEINLTEVGFPDVITVVA